MQGKIYEIPLDISSGVLTTQIRTLVTEDMGTNTFRFKLVKDKHVPYPLTGTIVRMMVKTPSGARIQQECTIENAVGGTISLTLKQSLLLEHGSHIAELQIYDAITQSIRLTTPTFDYHVRQSLQNSESIVATDEYTILQEALADLAGINIVVDDIRQEVEAVKAQSNQNATDLVTHKAENATQTQLGHVRLPENFINATLQNGWNNVVTIQYCKDDFGVVRVRGIVKEGTTAVNTILFTLPVGYRPSVVTYVSVMSYVVATDNISIIIQIAINGNVSLYFASKLHIELNFTFKI